MLEIRGLKKSFSGQQHVLRGLDLTLGDGDFVTVLGSNGAGKSTLFNAVAGVFLCDAGRITLDGADITFMPEHRRARWISRVFQNPLTGTSPSLTIEENLALAYSRGRGRGILSSAITKKDVALFRDLLSEMDMGLEDRLKTPIGLLSGGQRQVVTLLMCTIVPPKLLLLDEHTAALDPVTAEKVLAATKRIVAKQRLTTMMITHNLTSALLLGNRTIIMDGGRIALDLSEKDRGGLDADGLLSLYRQSCGDDDRTLFGKEDGSAK